ncbi:histidine phosphatase family protein [Pantanalinema rosaneae CENA516]|uniref:histidine phosphatase family protein n=1 Tax=Pantanalinema rosaneae TaxID=1620701 RepID=UPI003D6F4DC5
MTLYFIRHGKSEANCLHMISNRGDRYGLTPTGKFQSQTLTEKLKSFPISVIFTLSTGQKA